MDANSTKIPIPMDIVACDPGDDIMLTPAIEKLMISVMAMITIKNKK